MSAVSAEHVFDALLLALLGSVGALTVFCTDVVYEPRASRPPLTENFAVADAPEASEATSQLSVRVVPTRVQPVELAYERPDAYVATTRIPDAADGPVFVTVSV
jgi:hypothetical protein